MLSKEKVELVRYALNVADIEGAWGAFADVLDELAIMTDESKQAAKRANSLRVKNFEQRKEAERLRPDAERYRWLRENNIIDWEALSELWPESFDYVDSLVEHKIVDVLDLAIDAAMKEGAR